MSAVAAAEPGQGWASWGRWASVAYGAAALAFALIVALIAFVVAGYLFLGGGETGITAMGWLSIGLLALAGPPIVLLLLVALLGALLALLRFRRDGWLALFALCLALLLLLPASLFLPLSPGSDWGIWRLPGPVVGLYVALTTLTPLLLAVRWVAVGRQRAAQPPRA